MSSSQSPVLAGFLVPVRALSGHCPVPMIALVVLAALPSFGCRTPWSVEPLPVERLETGMQPEAVRTVLGEPGRVDAFPETSPRSRASSGIHPTQAWHYEDEKVDPVGLGVAALAFPLTVPLHLLAVAFRAEPADRDCMWVEQREIDLYFEDERLADWEVTTRPPRGWCANDGTWQGTPSWPSTTWSPSGLPTPSGGPISPPGRPGGC